MTDNKTYLDIPGEKSRELLARRQQFVARGVSSSMSVFAEKAEGAVIEDVDGNRYIDFAGGIGVMNIGHSRPEVVQAIAEQADIHDTDAPGKIDITIAIDIFNH